MPTRSRTPRRRKRTANLSPAFGLTEAIHQRQREEWLRKNHAALDAYNEHVEKDGVFSDGLRSF